MDHDLQKQSETSFDLLCVLAVSECTTLVKLLGIHICRDTFVGHKQYLIYSLDNSVHSSGNQDTLSKNSCVAYVGGSHCDFSVDDVVSDSHHTPVLH